MANALHHSMSSAKKFGGTADLYRHVHEWFDEPKGWMPDFRSRAIRHHAEGIAQAVKLFDDIELPSGTLVPVRFISEQHVIEDLGHIPTAADWLRQIEAEPWMWLRARRLSRELAE